MENSNTMTATQFSSNDGSNNNNNNNNNSVGVFPFPFSVQHQQRQVEHHQRAIFGHPMSTFLTTQQQQSMLEHANLLVTLMLLKQAAAQLPPPQSDKGRSMETLVVAAAAVGTSGGSNTISQKAPLKRKATMKNTIMLEKMKTVCERCTLLKTKCIRAEGDSAGSCKRCIKAGECCVFLNQRKRGPMADWRKLLLLEQQKNEANAAVATAASNGGFPETKRAKFDSV